jgi:hypothetical protein
LGISQRVGSGQNVVCNLVLCIAVIF